MHDQPTPDGDQHEDSRSNLVRIAHTHVRHNRPYGIAHESDARSKPQEGPPDPDSRPSDPQFRKLPGAENTSTECRLLRELRERSSACVASFLARRMPPSLRGKQ